MVWSILIKLSSFFMLPASQKLELDICRLRETMAAQQAAAAVRGTCSLDGLQPSGRCFRSRGPTWICPCRTASSGLCSNQLCSIYSGVDRTRVHVDEGQGSAHVSGTDAGGDHIVHAVAAAPSSVKAPRRGRELPQDAREAAPPPDLMVLDEKVDEKEARMLLLYGAEFWDELLSED